MVNGEGRKPLDLVISAGLLLVLAVVCYQVLAPFLGLLVWSLILAVVLYPLHQWLARRLGGRQGGAATLMVVLALLLIGVPVALLSSSLADSVIWLVDGVRDHSLQVPLPPNRVAALPLVGDKLHAVWTLAATDLPALIHQLQPKLGELARAGLGFVGGLGGAILLFLLSFVVAAILMAYGSGSAGTGQALAVRIAGAERGANFARLATATIRAVALGVVGVAAIQALLVGISLLLFAVPGAGLLTLFTLVLAILQLPVIVITLPVIAWVWLAGDYGPLQSGVLTLLLLVAGLADNLLKPLLLGRGVDAPMPVVLIGALGGMVHNGIQGMFVGAVVLAIGYQLLMGWISEGASQG